jgi:histidine kinase
MKLVKNIKISLSQKIILSMAGMVLLTVFASGLLFYLVFTNRVDDFNHRLDNARQIVLQNTNQTIVSDTEIVSRLRTAVNNPNANPKDIIDLAHQTLNVNHDVNDAIIRTALGDTTNANGTLKATDTTVPTTVPGPKPGLGPGPGPVRYIGPNNWQDLGNVIFSPVANSIWLGVCISALIAIALGAVLARGIVKPLRGLEKASEQVADGNYKLEIKQSRDSDLARLASSFNRMAKTLSQTEQKRKDLLTDISHEFRTPLSSIQGYTEVLRDGLVEDKERQNEIYDHILKEVKHLNTMVNSMRAWVNNEQMLENLNLTETGVANMVEEVVNRFQPTANQKNIKLELEIATPEPRVRTDTDAVMHALSNLVDNALRYTAEDGQVCVKIGYTSSQTKSNSKQKRVWFQVSDTGEGIAAEHLPFVFERFYRVDKSRSRHTGGTGLGLAIVRDTVQTLGGEVLINSEVGVGTDIAFWLPALPNQRPTRHLLPVFSGAQSNS